MKPDPDRPEAVPPDQSSGATAASVPAADAGPRSQQQTSQRPPHHLPPVRSPFQPPHGPHQHQQQQHPAYRPGPNGSNAKDGGQAFHPAQGRPPVGGGRMPSFNGPQGGGYRPDLHNARRPSQQRANGSPALNNGGFMTGGVGANGNGQQRGSVGGGGMYYGGDGSYGQPLAANPYGAPSGGGWYSPSQLPLRFSPPDGSGHSAQDGSSVSGVFAPSALSSPAQSTSTSPAAGGPFAFNPYAPPNPYVMPPSSGSPHYFVPPPVPQGMYPPSGPPSSIDSEPSSPAPGSSSTASSSPHTIQSHNGQTWMYVPVQMSGYYGQPGSIAFSAGPLSSSDGSFSSQGGQGPQIPIYGSSPHAPYGFQQPPQQQQQQQQQAFNPQQAQQQQQQHTPPFYSSQQPPPQQQPYGRPRGPLASASSGTPNGQYQSPVTSGTVIPMPTSNVPNAPPGRGPGPTSNTPTPPNAGAGGRRPGPAMRGGNNSPAPTRKAWHPAPPAQRSEWVMWCGNVPSDATQDELWRFFTGPLSKRPVSSHGGSPKAPSAVLDDTAETLTAAAEAGELPAASPIDPSVPVPFDGECEVASIFLIARSSCCFVNYRSQEALDSAISRFNGLPIRPLEGPRSLRLVCRVRRKEDDLKAGVGGQRGRGVHKDWVKDKQAQAAAASTPRASSPKRADTGESNGESRTASGLTAVATTPQSHRGSTISSQASTDSSFLARYFPIRYFILKSLTQVDLDTSLKTGLWATQPHNEPVLDQAFRTSKEVVLIFGANKTGEFFGYARMAGPIKKGVSRLSWASRSSAPMISPTASTAGLSPTAATYPAHPSQQRSAPSMIAEGSEEEGPEQPRATTHPSSAKPPFFRTSASQSSVSRHELQDSPGEITTGIDYVSAMAKLDLDEKAVPATTPNSLLGRKAGDVDHASTPRNSAPAALGAAELESQQHETAINIARQLSHESDRSSPPRTLSETETAAIISEIGKASAEGSAAHTPLSPPKFAQATGSHPELPALGRDGVRRVDHAMRGSSAGVELNTGSAGSGPSAASFTGSSAGASSARSFPFPNEHLPATPEATTESLPAEKATTGVGEGETWGTPFNVEWLQTRRLPFYRVKHLRNPWNQNREIKVSRDGTELEPDVGRQLLNIWNTSPASATENLPTSPASATSQGEQVAQPITFTSHANYSQTKAVGSEPDVLGLGLSTPIQSGQA